jgi:hypothetical protein
MPVTTEVTRRARAAHEAAHALCALQAGGQVKEATLEKVSGAELRDGTPGQEGMNLLVNLVGQAAEDKAMGKGGKQPDNR